MTQQPQGSEQADSGYEPDFVLPRHGAIREDNWEDYRARGLQPAHGPFEATQAIAGVEHVYTGDAYDYEAGRPLRHKPGIGVYVDPEGIEQMARGLAKHKQWLRDHGF